MLKLKTEHLAVMTEAQTPEMKGRSRLKGVLDGLVQQSKDEKEGDPLMVVDEDVEEGARDLLELNDDGGVFSVPRKRPRTARSPSRRKGRKRMCKQIFTSNDSDISDFEDSHISHVMTLFDRRVDLARFLPDTPLYVMCREWMWNSPHRLPTTTDSAQDNLFHQPHPFKPPTPLPRDAKGDEVRLDIPKPHPPHTESQEELDRILKHCFSQSGVNFDLSELKQAHLARWRLVRDNWKNSSSMNLTRYAQSFSTIRKLFQR